MQQGKYTYSSFACIFVILVLGLNFGRDVYISLSGDSYRQKPPFPPDRIVGADFQCYNYMALRVRYGLPLYDERDYSDSRQLAMDDHYRRLLGPMPEEYKSWIIRVQPIPWNHPPLAACLFIPFSFLPHPWAYRLYLGVLIAALIAGLSILGRYSIYRMQYWTVASSLIAFSYPLMFSLERGTSESLAMFLVAMVFMLWYGGWSPVWTGLCVALAGHLKVYPFALLYYFLIKKEWRICASIVVSSVSLALAGSIFSREGFSGAILQYYKMYRFVVDKYIPEYTWIFAGNHSTYSFLCYATKGWVLSPRSLLILANIINLALLALFSAGISARKAEGLPCRLVDFSLMIVLMMIIPAAANDYSLVMLYFVFAACILCFERMRLESMKERILFMLFSLTASLIFLPTMKIPVGDGPTGGYIEGLWFISNKWPLIIILAAVLLILRMSSSVGGNSIQANIPGDS